jgi:hypothetical protein
MEDHRETPEISLECVMKSAGLIEQMGRDRLKPSAKVIRPLDLTKRNLG